MASLIPALSEKARIEIGKKNWQYYLDNEKEMSFPVAIEAFQDLFDLEKYPITPEIMVEYFNKQPLVIQEKSLKGSNIDENIFYIASTGVCVNPYKDKFYYILGCLLYVLDYRDIDIIGDIHGWWEKPQTY